MNLKLIKKGIVVVTVAGTVMIPVGQATVAASDIGTLTTLSRQQSESSSTLMDVVAEITSYTNTEKTIKIESSEEIQLGDFLSKKVFAQVNEEGYFIIRNAADGESDAVGKVFEDTALTILEKDSEWTKISSGNVEGYIPTESLITGKSAAEKAKTILEDIYPDTDLTTLEKDVIDACFSVGETVEEEAARLAQEEAERIAAEEARIAAEAAAKQEAIKAQGQSVVAYATQFLGNPYVYGGTSLTRGTDCSGFVKGVFANFGISLPHSSYGMRSMGYEVSYSEMLPGDVVCYSGHVGIYAGNGMIINAINERKGIGYTSVNYARIITIRRMY